MFSAFKWVLFYPIPVCADMNPPIFLAASACIFSAYRREYKKRFAHIAAGKCTQEQFLQWAAEARKEKLKCAAGIITMEAYLDWLKNSN